MLEKDTIVVNVRELRKLQAANKAIGKEMSQKEAARLAGVSERQMRRVIKAVRSEGAKGVVHRARGKPSNRRIDGTIKEKVMRTYEDRYRDFGPTFACEKFRELDGITISRETLRCWLMADGFLKPRRKNKVHRLWRERKEHFGEMVQMDGSDHDWLEGRGPRLTLMGYVDDATGSFTGSFYRYEGTLPAMDSLKRYIGTYGIPQSIYLDKHSTYTVNRPLTIEEELTGIEKSLTQFERAAVELGIDLISAHSPQAKGRIERSFGTHQDRLIKEMRLRGIDTIDDANAYLKEYCARHNAKYAVPAKSKADFHVKVKKRHDLERILCIKERRRIKNDNTISFEGKLYLIEDKVDAKHVTVEIHTDENMVISAHNGRLRFKHIEPRTKVSEIQTTCNTKERPIVIPPPDHPWRRSRTAKKSAIVAYLK